MTNKITPRLRKFLVEVGQVTGHHKVLMGTFRVEATKAEDAFSLALNLAEAYNIDDAIVMSMVCEDRIIAI